MGGLGLRIDRDSAHASTTNRQGIGTQLVQRLEGMFAKEGMRTVVVRTVWFVGMSKLKTDRSFSTFAYAYTAYTTNQMHQQADTPETNMPARCFLEGMHYGSPVSHVCRCN